VSVHEAHPLASKEVDRRMFLHRRRPSADDSVSLFVGNLTNEEDLLRVADESEAFTLLQWAVYKQKWRWCETYGEAALFLDGTHCVAPLAGGKKGGGVTAHEQQKPSIDAKRTLGTILLV
jgi:hypothetical protein